MVGLTLPYPPSANSLWRAVRGRNIKSEGYRAWCVQAATAIMLQRPRRVAGPFRLTIIATRPDRRRRDCTNLIKATEDSLVANGVIDDDHLAESVFIAWSSEAPRKDATVRVEIEPVTPAQAQQVAA